MQEEVIIFAVQAEGVPNHEEGGRLSVERVICDLVNEIAGGITGTGTPPRRPKTDSGGAENA